MERSGLRMVVNCLRYWVLLLCSKQVVDRSLKGESCLGREILEQDSVWVFWDAGCIFEIQNYIVKIQIKLNIVKRIILS